MGRGIGAQTMADSSRRAAGQSSVEYALVIALVIAAIVAMEAYVRRGIQAREKTLVDGSTAALGARPQYEPYYASADTAVTQESEVTTTYAPGGRIARNNRSETKVDAGGRQTVGTDLQADDNW